MRGSRALFALLAALTLAGPACRTATEERAHGAAVVERAYRERISGIVVEVEGVVQRRLGDDDRGSRHQRFILEIADGHTLLVAHNIDLARRVPLAVGDSLAVRGQYEWNDRGGVLHWTHHDPDGDRPGGWIRHRGVTYR